MEVEEESWKSKGRKLDIIRVHNSFFYINYTLMKNSLLRKEEEKKLIIERPTNKILREQKQREHPYIIISR
jgi:MFS superfamily sulfate permease-like transporter